MLILDRNDTLYNEYFEWKRKYKIVAHEPNYCRVCEFLNKSKNINKSYTHLDSFWNKTQDCYKPYEFYTNINMAAWK